MRPALLVAVLASACVQTTGGNLVTFGVEAVGTPAAASFVSGKGYDVTLSRARLFVGAIYLNQTNPGDWSLETSCILPGTYSGEVRGALSIDALSGEPQPFDVMGNGIDTPARAAELWLTDGDVNDDDSKAVILDVEGMASRGGQSWPFTASLTIGNNRKQQPDSAARPGGNPICKERIVTPIPTELKLASGGTLTLSVDPRAWFLSVEFSELRMSSSTPGSFEFVDDSSTAGPADVALYNGMRAAKGPYAFQWR